MIPGVVGGTETYARGLLEGLKQLQPDYDFIIFLNREAAEMGLNDSPRFRSVVCPVTATNRKARYYFEQAKLGSYIRSHKIDLLHSLGYTSPLFLSCPTVVSVPDLNFKGFGNLMSFSRRAMLNMFVRQAILRSEKVITISEFSRQQVLKAYKIPPENVVVTHLAVALDHIETRTEGQIGNTLQLLGVKPPYIVAFSSTTPNKNLSRLVDAFSLLKKSKKVEEKLVLIGHKPEVGQDIDSLGDDIIWVGYLERQQVFDVLRNASCLVFPSFYEGFGLPVLEAMASGVPVVCSRAASLPEVAGNAAVFFDPFSVDDMAERITSVALDPQLRQELRKKGFKNLERFSWRKTAAETVAVYDELLRTSVASPGFEVVDR